MTKKKELPLKIKCPDCDAEYSTNKGLSSHRRAAHGYVSNTYSAQRERRIKADKQLACPDCGFIASNRAGLTIHRKSQHDAASESDTAVAIRASNPLQCPECSFVASVIGGLKLHLRKQHGIINHEKRDTERKRLEREKERGLTIAKVQTITAVHATSNGHHPSSQETHTAPASDPIPEATLAIGLGRFQELSRQLAVEHDLPPRMYASRLAGLIYAATVR